MTTLIAVDGHSLNVGLQKVAQSRNKNDQGNKPRFRIDHEQLAEFLLEEVALSKDKNLRFYTDNQPVSEPKDSRIMGKVVKYFSAKGYGFVAATDGSSYFFHNNDITNKRALCDAREERYPHPTSKEFSSRVMGKVVSFVPATVDGKTRAEEVRLEFGSRVLDEFYRLRKEPFLEMLRESGYDIVRCQASNSTGKAKSIDCRIYLEALTELEEDDHFVLLSDDIIFQDLLEQLQDYGVGVTLVSFDTPRSKELRDYASQQNFTVVLLDDYLDDLELAFEDDLEGEESQDSDYDELDISAEQKALANV